MKTNTVLISLTLFAIFLFQACANSKLAKTEKELAETKQLVVETNAELSRKEQKLDTALLNVEKATIENRKLIDQKLRYEKLLSDENELKRLLNRYTTSKKRTEKFNSEAQKHKHPEIVFDRILNETIYITISNAEMLTQRMGSAGANAYMREAIETLASVDGINCVDFDFKEGDHAAPGEYCN